MAELFFSSLEIISDFFWIYLGLPVLLMFGLYFSIKSRWFQVRMIPEIFRMFYGLMTHKDDATRGVPVLHAFFASIGGALGIGNVVGVAAAVQLGGPGAIFWMWVGGLFGMIIKYAEIYLSIAYRVENNRNSFDGGPIQYLKRASHSSVLSVLFAISMCLYGVEIYVFRVVSYSIASTWNLNYFMVIGFMLVAILGVGSGGVRQVGRVSSVLIPVFLIIYTAMGLWILGENYTLLPDMFALIFRSAFTPHAAIGSFVGSSLIRTIAIGVQRACYAGDLGIGYAGMIHAEADEANPARQGSLGIIGVIIDTFIICTFSTLLILITGMWNMGIHEDKVVAYAFSLYIPQILNLWPIFVFLLGYGTIIAYYSAGRKAAMYLSPKYGERLYLAYAICAFVTFSFIGHAHHMMMIMSIIQIPLMLLNFYGLWKLHLAIKFPAHIE